MAASLFQGLLHSIADAGRELLDIRLGSGADGSVEGLTADLLSQKGEASGTALARDLVAAYGALDAPAKAAFFAHLADRYAPDLKAAAAAARRFAENPDTVGAARLAAACEAPRQELFRRLNMAPGGTWALVEMRADLLRALDGSPELDAVDDDLAHLLGSWFNRGFLELRQIDWRTPAVVLEKLIAYEAVHAIKGWDDLRRRLARDRMCFAFFHPALEDEPLIFVEVALTQGMASSIDVLLDRSLPPGDPAKADAAIFYSINNCQDGLRGISFGNFLIKQVVSELARDWPRIKTFATLSPVPGFRRWLDHTEADAAITEARSLLATADWPATGEKLLSGLCARYLLEEKKRGRPVDPVARFHLGNGARLERINWQGDPSENGVRQSAGMLVNYAYAMADIEKNHEAYANEGTVSASRAVKNLL